MGRPALRQHPGELAVGLRPLGLELLTEDEAGNIAELREQHEAVWQTIVGRGLVHLTPPDTRYPLDDDQLRGGIEVAHERAVDAAIGHALSVVPMIRRPVASETVVRERPAEVLATSWQHTTARAVESRAPDPQLHSHVLLHGAVREDGKVVAVESRALFVQSA